MVGHRAVKNTPEARQVVGVPVDSPAGTERSGTERRTVVLVILILGAILGFLAGDWYGMRTAFRRLGKANVKAQMIAARRKGR